ncbi:Protein pellino [Halotydeus destructor]|nr:Protein pellino [Halotydeus destructor]
MGRQAFDAVRSSGAPRSGPSTPQSENCSFSESIRSSPCNSQMLGKDETVPYGELIILGYNGTLPQGERGRRRSKYILYKRSVPNGIRKSRHYIVKQPQQTKAIQDKKQHSISYTLSRNQAVIVEYTHDDDTDLFQIGRSSESPIDFVVIDTPTSNKANEKVCNRVQYPDLHVEFWWKGSRRTLHASLQRALIRRETSSLARRPPNGNRIPVRI